MNKERLLNQINQDGIAVLIASTPENVGYLTGFWMSIQQVARWVETYTLISNSMEKPILIASLYGLVSHSDLIEPEELRIMPYGVFFVSEEAIVSRTDEKIKEILSIEKSKSATEALINAIKEENLDNAVIGIENLMPFQTLNQLKKEFPKLRIKGAPDLFHRVRMVKTDDEIEKLKKSATIIEKAIDIMLQNLTEGISEIEAANIMNQEIIKKGAGPAFTVVQFGINSPHVDAQPTENRLQNGDIIHIDAGCTFKHYYSDTARTVVFGGETTPKQRKYFNAIVNAQKRGIEMAKPGVKASEIFDVMLEEMKKGIPHANRSNVGHGIGLELWEPPLLIPGNDTLLEKGMVINLEPPYSELGFGGLQVEDTLSITETGNEVMTTIDKTLQI